MSARIRGCWMIRADSGRNGSTRASRLRRPSAGLRSRAAGAADQSPRQTSGRVSNIMNGAIQTTWMMTSRRPTYRKSVVAISAGDIRSVSTPDESQAPIPWGEVRAIQGRDETLKHSKTGRILGSTIKHVKLVT